MSGNSYTPPKITGNTAFFYGTLMAVPMLSRVIYGTTSPEAWQVASLFVRPAVLHSHCRYQVRFADYPGIVPEDGKSVRGTYVGGLTIGDVFRLDMFEGEQYERKKVQIKILDSNGKEGDEDLETEAYIWTAGRDELEDKEWDFQEFVNTKLARWAGSSDEYTEVDEASKADIIEADIIGTNWWQAPTDASRGGKEVRGENFNNVV